MSEPGKNESGGIADRATELANKAAAAAGPLANKAAAAAGPLAAQARERATGLAHQAAPHVTQARQVAGKGVAGLAERLSKLSGGKYADKINAVSTKITEKLDDKPASGSYPAADETTGTYPPAVGDPLAAEPPAAAGDPLAAESAPGDFIAPADPPVSPTEPPVTGPGGA